ncbi:MAG: ABC transporter permease, partial [Desulfonatronovibrionaceae bacterium]
MFFLRRLILKTVWLGLVLLGITVISFWIIHLAPGSPTDMQTTLSPTAGAEARQRLEKIYGLDQPVHIQYRNWVKRVIQLDFGNSLSGDSRPVWDKIRERLPLTLSLNIISMFLILGISIPIGVLSALNQGGWLDRSLTVLVFAGFAMPSFWLALLLMMALGIYLPVFPISGMTSLDFEHMSFWGKVVDLVRHLALPVIVFTITGLAG